MKRTVRNYIIRIAIMAALAAAVILIALTLRPSWADSTEQRGDREITQDNDLLLWYYDESLTPYVQQLQAAYFKKTGLRVGYELVSVVSFFENINKRNVAGNSAPDLYIIDTTRLEQAYLGSAAKENAFPDIYSLQNYGVKALTSVRYKGKQVAYPLCFDMEYFVYNRDYMDRAPRSFEALAEDSSNFKKAEDSPVDMVILYDVNDLLFNYHFIGGVIDLGGETGDDDTEIVLDKETLLPALLKYQEFSKMVNINRTTTDYDLVENSFVFGRSMTALLKCSSLTALNQENTNYEICEMPAVSDTISSKALSATWCVCVNPISDNVSDAENMAKFMTYDYADAIYDLTGLMSCRRLDYTDAGFDQVYNLYDQTASLPKFMETEELWKDMKNMFLSIWDGTEAEEAADIFLASFYHQFSSRSGNEQESSK